LTPPQSADAVQERMSWAQAACARVMRPLVRLALAMGLKHAQLEEMLRDLLLSEARRLWQEQGVAQPNISQLAITTGLNRKEVTARVRRPQSDPLPHTEMSSAAKTFTRWLRLAAERPVLRRLPVAAGNAGLSFEDVARQASRGDVHHRAVLDELVRLGMCEEQDGFAELKADGFVPSSDLQSTLAFLGDNLRDHANAAVSNTLGGQLPLLERAVFADGLTPEDCDAVHRLARERWAAVHRDLVDALTEAVERSGGQGDQRARIGMYVYLGDAVDPNAAADENKEEEKK
jgi:hypothetical protein